MAPRVRPRLAASPAPGGDLHNRTAVREILGDDARTDYLVDALLAALAPELFLYQREVRGMSLEDLIDGWQTVADAVVATATATPSRAS